MCAWRYFTCFKVSEHISYFFFSYCLRPDTKHAWNSLDSSFEKIWPWRANRGWESGGRGQVIEFKTRFVLTFKQGSRKVICYSRYLLGVFCLFVFCYLPFKVISDLKVSSTVWWNKNAFNHKRWKQEETTRDEQIPKSSITARKLWWTVLTWPVQYQRKLTELES